MWPEILKVVFGLMAVIAMIGLGALAAQKSGLVAMRAAGRRRRRLSLIETLPLDAKRRLMIIRCDDRDHLIVIGAAGETVIERNLEPAAASAQSIAEPAIAFPSFSRAKTDAAA